MGLCLACRSSSNARFRWLEERRSHVLHEFGAAAVIHDSTTTYGAALREDPRRTSRRGHRRRGSASRESSEFSTLFRFLSIEHLQFDPSLDTKSTPKEPVQTTPLERSEYNVQILRHIQRLFGHLLESKLQFYIPRGFWKIFKYVAESSSVFRASPRLTSRFAGEPVNVREQQDAVEFLNTLVDCLDEALKTLNLPQICSRVLGGKFADQKICKDCPHRYVQHCHLSYPLHAFHLI